MASLVDHSLLTRESGPDDEPRFRMLETIREYGLEWLEAGQAEGAQAAHARYFLRFAQALRPWTVMRATRAPVDRLAADDANLHAALGWLDENGPAADFVGLAVACWMYWYIQGRLREAELWLERASGKREAGSPTDRARLLIAIAELLMLKGESARAEAVFTEGLPLKRAISDPFDLTLALISHGASLSFSGKYAEAEIQLGEALTTAEAITDPTLRDAVAGRALANLGVAARGHGDLDLALTRGQEALRRYEGLALDLAEAHALLDLGEVAREQGSLRLAVERYLAAMERTSDEGEVRLFADALTGIAVVAAIWGQSRTAVLLFGAADSLRQRGGFAVMLPGDAATAAQHLAVLRETLGDEAFTAIWTESCELPVAEVVNVAATLTPRPDTLRAVPVRGATALTRREEEIVHLLAAGLTDREIADALFISPGTVSWHVHSILGKLDAMTRHEAVDRARASGLL